MKNVLNLIIFLVLTLLPAPLWANPLEGGWTMRSDVSNLRFQSVKNSTVVESSSFATVVGKIEDSGMAEIRVLLDSVDTKIDLRNVRMRFLFFETFKFSEAVISMQIDPAQLTDLRELRRKTLPVTYTLDLHGFKKELTAEVAVTLLSDNLVSIASAAPISISVADFGLTENIKKLEEAAGGITIIPSATVSFDFLFARNSTPDTESVSDLVASAEPVETEMPEPTVAIAPTGTTTAALEPSGNFDKEACVGRFEILSRSGNIFFGAGSAVLDPASHALLDTVVDIVNRCPDLRLEVGGHTDSDGSERLNQRLSEARAKSVTDYLIERGVDAGRVSRKGYGEASPVFPNTSAYNKSRNRRIEFAVLN